MARLKREDQVKTAIVRVLKERDQLGFNMLYEEVHKRIRCGRNQFTKYLKELEKEAAVSSKKSPTHRAGIILELGPDASKYVQTQLRFFADSLLSALLPFAEFRDTGSIEAQLATYDLAKLLPFRIRIELTSEAGEKRRIVAEGTLEKDGSISNSRIVAT